MENEKLDRIDEFLLQYSASRETISNAKISQLKRIDEAIQKRLAEAQKAQDLIKNSVINITTIAEDSGISRKTFYNNDLLRLYVEQYSDDKDESDKEIERLKVKCAEQEHQIRQFLLRDIETENLRQEIALLNAELRNYKTRNENLEKQYEKLLQDLQDPREKSQCTVLQLDNKFKR